MRVMRNWKMAPPERIELPACRFVADRSNPLSYGGKMVPGDGFEPPTHVL